MIEEEDYLVNGISFLQALDRDTLEALLDTNDELGAVLRIHFLLEKHLEIWCSEITGYNDFFSFDSRASFGLKLALAKKFELDTNVASFIQTFNNIRNGFAHQRNQIVSDNNLNSLRYAVDRIPGKSKIPNSNNKMNIPAVADPSMTMQIDDREVSWNDEGLTNVDKLTFLFFVFSLKTMTVLTDDIAKKRKSI